MLEELTGKTLGKYRIDLKIGEGGMAAVFKAYQSDLDRDVAIKVLPTQFVSQNPEAYERFKREAKAIAKFKHDHILPIYDFGEDQGYTYMVMHFVAEGKTLSRTMRQDLSLEEKLRLIVQVGQALEFAHQKGIIHRDIKPSNILIEENHALLADFGIAKVTEAVTRLTSTGAIIGTPAYVSPEQAQNEKIDNRTDIYSLGIILFEMLTGTVPHDAETPWSIVARRISEPPPKPTSINPGIPPILESVVLRALATKPEKRYKSAKEFVSALESILRILEREDATIRSSSPMAFNRRRWLLPFQNKVVLIVIGVAILTLGGLSMWSELIAPVSSEPPSSSPMSRVTITDQLSAMEQTSTPPPSLTPTLTPTHTPRPTSTFTSIPPTNTPLVVVITATSPTVPTDTPTFTPTPTPDAPASALPVMPTPPGSVPVGEFNLLAPLNLHEPTFGPTQFEWEWTGALSPEYGFEVSVWVCISNCA